MSQALHVIHRMDRNLVVQAGAGTGKTHNLVKLYVHLLSGLTGNAPRRELGLRMGETGHRLDKGPAVASDGAQFGFRPDQIVAMTFTDKAAAEMRERIQDKLSQLERDPTGDEDLNASAAALGRQLPTPRRWRELRLELSHAFIGTFHSYCGRVLRENAVAAGLDPHFALIGAQGEDQELFEEVAKEIILGESHEGGDAHKALYRYQLSQDMQFGGGLLQHMKTLYDRLQVAGRPPEEMLVGSAYEPEQVRRDLDKAVRAYLADLQTLADAAESYTAKTREKLRKLSQWLAGLGPALSNQSPDATNPLWALLGEPKQILSRAVLGDLKDLGESCKERLEDVTSLRATFDAIPIAEDVQRLLTQVTTAFHKRKAEQGVLDFQDMLVRARDLLRDNPAVRRKVKGDVGILLVDEFQDTDRLQKDLVYLMAEAVGAEAALAPGQPVEAHIALQPAKLFVVGDRKQSIYAFRGADVEIFEQTLEELSSGRLAGEPPSEPVSLNQCRRSLPAVIDACNVLFSAIMGGEGSSGFDPRLDALGAFRPAHGVSAALELMTFKDGASWPDGSPTPNPAKGELNAQEKARLQARAVAARIQEIIATGLPLVHQRDPITAEEVSRPPTWGDITILLRRYAKLSTFTTELILQRIPHIVVKGRGFYGAQEVRDLVNCLRLISDPDAHVALLGVLRSPLVGLSDEALVGLALGRQPTPGLRLRDLSKRLLSDQSPPLQPPPGVAEADLRRLTDFVLLHRRLRRQADRLGCASLLEATLEATGFDAALAGTFQGEQKLANIEKLLNLARDFDERGVGGVPGFVRRMTRLLEEEPREGVATVQGEGEDIVRIMTVHASKGLEFPIVIVPECEASSHNRSPPMVYDKELGFAISLANPRPGVKRTPTGSYGAISAKNSARGKAELQRLLYVAVTRSREHCILLGLGKAQKDTWLSWIDDAHAALAERGLLLERDGWAYAGRPEPDFSRTCGPETLEQLNRQAALLSPELLEAGHAQYQAALPPNPASIKVRRLVAPVTQLDDFSLCARRYLLWHELNLEEHPNLRGNREEDPQADAAIEAAEETSVQLDPLRRGTLAHALLEEVNLPAFSERGAEVINEMLLDQGYALEDPQVQSVRDDVAALLSSEFGKGLRTSPEANVRREWPFTLHLRGANDFDLFVTGKMDLMVQSGDVVRVIDYKHTRREKRTAADYHFQLMSYALAATKLLGAQQVEAEIVFLRDRHHSWGDSPMTLTPDAQSLQRFEADLLERALALVHARLADSFPKSARTHCEDVRCGYLWRCHPVPR